MEKIFTGQKTQKLKNKELKNRFQREESFSLPGHFT